VLRVDSPCCREKSILLAENEGLKQASRSSQELSQSREQEHSSAEKHSQHSLSQAAELTERQNSLISKLEDKVARDSVFCLCYHLCVCSVHLFLILHCFIIVDRISTQNVAQSFASHILATAREFVAKEAVSEHHGVLAHDQHQDSHIGRIRAA
jgi:hypothetical protein